MWLHNWSYHTYYNEAVQHIRHNVTGTPTIKTIMSYLKPHNFVWRDAFCWLGEKFSHWNPTLSVNIEEDNILLSDTQFYDWNWLQGISFRTSFHLFHLQSAMLIMIVYLLQNFWFGLKYILVVLLSMCLFSLDFKFLCISIGWVFLFK